MEVAEVVDEAPAADEDTVTLDEDDVATGPDDEDAITGGSHAPVSGLHTSVPVHAVAHAPHGLAPARHPWTVFPPGPVSSVQRAPPAHGWASHAGKQKFPTASCAQCPAPQSASAMHVRHSAPPEEDAVADVETLPPPELEATLPPLLLEEDDPSGVGVGQPRRAAQRTRRRQVL
jgi:hypothetical protein